MTTDVDRVTPEPAASGVWALGISTSAIWGMPPTLESRAETGRGCGSPLRPPARRSRCPSAAVRSAREGAEPRSQSSESPDAAHVWDTLSLQGVGEERRWL